MIDKKGNSNVPGTQKGIDTESDVFAHYNDLDGLCAFWQSKQFVII